jgi:alpha,alpha-trehalase
MKLFIDNIEACIMDMDGVVTDMADVHAKAWKQVFDDFLTARARRKDDRIQLFDAGKDYQDYVDGKPRYDGVESFLAARSITLPYGDPGDSPEKVTVCGLGNRKNAVFNAFIEKEGVKVFDSRQEIKKVRR